MSKFLDVTDADAFVDFPVKEKPRHGKDYVACPVCDRHGGWNLTVNAYPLRDKPDTSENRHNYSHFRCSCSQCNGWGWVNEEDAKCIHEMAHHQNLGRCFNEYICVKCGKKKQIDSGD